MVQAVERGHVFFAYRPKVGIETARSLADVQRLFVIVEPQTGARRFRRMLIGRKRLPDVALHERVWGFVDLVSPIPEPVRDALGRQAYETKTRGRREVAEARPAGEGVYGIVCHDDHTHFAYQLELPKRPGPVQRAFGIGGEGSYVIAVVNPANRAPRGVGLGRHRAGRLPPELQRLFGHRRFISADPPALLDQPNVEFVLIGASPDVGAELGIDLQPERETIDRAELFRHLGLEPRRPLTDPLAKGVWH